MIPPQHPPDAQITFGSLKGLPDLDWISVDAGLMFHQHSTANATTEFMDLPERILPSNLEVMVLRALERPFCSC